MTNKLIIPETEEETNVVSLETDFAEADTDWLWGLPIGTVFLMAQRPQQVKDRFNRDHTIKDHNLGEYHIIDKDYYKGAKSVKLLTNLNEDHKSWVDSEVFSNSFILTSVRHYGKKE